MPTSLPSRRGSAHSLSTLPYHRSKFYKSSNHHGKTKASLYHQHHQQQQQRRRRTWLIVIILLVIFIVGGGRLFFSSSSKNNNDASHLLDFPEWTIAHQFQPSPVKATTIPKIVHFVYGLKAPDPTLDLIHYLSIKSAHERLSPDKILFHYHYLPRGPLFDLAKPYLTLHKVDLVPTVFDRPVTHFAHQADIIRLAMLQQYGGIYLDLDVISMAPMDHLLDNEFVMGQEGIDGSVGLCNAVILAKPNARFLQRWQETYRTFDQSNWNYHSVVLPGKLAMTGAFTPNEITILNHTAFFWPLWDSHGLRTLFLEKSYNFTQNYASHIWESAANPHLMKDLSMDVIRHVDNSLYCQLRRLLPDDDDTPARPCRQLEHSTLPDQQVGYWPLMKPNGKTLLNINPTPATDVSGNDMHGIIRNGYYGDGIDGAYVSGQDSYVFLSMPTKMTMDALTVQWQMKTSDDKQGGVAMMVQSDTCKIMVKTQAHGVLGVEVWALAANGWAWTLVDAVDGAKAFGIHDDTYHTFTLVLQATTTIKNGGSMLVPDLVLYMDGMVVASLSQWIPTDNDNDNSNNAMVVRGIWFGSAEPAKYQDPWDTRPSLAAWYKDLRVWEQPLTIDTIRAGFNNNSAEEDGQQKNWHVVVDGDIPVTHDDDNDNVNNQWQDDDDGLD